MALALYAFAGGGAAAKGTHADRVRISWSEARALITSCGVRELGQTHALTVTLTLRDGTERFTREPAIDDVIEVLNGTQDTCAPVTFATE